MGKKPAPHVELRMRLVAAHAEPIGPGKVALLESIGRTGSISAAAREHAMSYSRAWKLVTEINEAFRSPLVLTATGGAAGGGATLTDKALQLIALYRQTESDMLGAAEAQLRPLLRTLVKVAPKKS